MWENPDHCRWWCPWACGPPWPLSVPAPTFMFSSPSTMNYNLQTKTLYSPKFFLVMVFIRGAGKQAKARTGLCSLWKYSRPRPPVHSSPPFPCITGHRGLLHSGIFTTPWDGLPLFSRKAFILPEMNWPCTQLPLQYKQTSNSYQFGRYSLPNKYNPQLHHCASDKGHPWAITLAHPHI